MTTPGSMKLEAQIDEEISRKAETKAIRCLSNRRRRPKERAISATAEA